MLPLRTLLIGLLGFFIAPCSRAQLVLVAYDGFDYATGAVDGQNGGSGWSGAWDWEYTSGSSLTVSASGLSYSGLDTTDGSVTWASGGNGISQASRSLALVDSGVVYLQFLGQFGSSSGGGTPNIRLYAGNALTGGFGANGGDYGGVVSILDTNLNPASDGSSSSSASLSALNLVVARIDYTNNETRLWTNPNLSTFDYLNPSAADATYAGLAPAFDKIAIYTRYPGTVDEIGVYTAIPEPAHTTTAIAMLALLGLGAIRLRQARRQAAHRTPNAASITGC
ncbi:MAG TPA: hypothetical protein VGD81_00365 [Opitutaceae bacterium]